MDISINMDIEPLMKRFERMSDKINNFKRVGIGSEMSNWQVEDMHRDKPFTMRWRAQGRAQTKVRQHSLYEMLRSQGAAMTLKEQKKIVRGLKGHLKYRVRRGFYKSLQEHRHWSTREILRKQMEEDLMQRMSARMKRDINWGTGYIWSIE
jgi:hypothetical protein